MFDWIVQHSIPFILLVIFLHFLLAGLGIERLNWLYKISGISKKE